MSHVYLLIYLLTYEAEPFLRSHQLCSHSRTSQHFTKPEGSIQCSQELSTADERTKCSGLNGSKHYQSSISLQFLPESGFDCPMYMYTLHKLNVLRCSNSDNKPLLFQAVYCYFKN
jgi:hypothetical protein